MKRLHLHMSVPELTESVRFYETLFGAPPTVLKDDYAKWMLEDPRVNFAISARGRSPGVDHVGIQVESGEELAALSGRLKAAGRETFDQTATTCCYAKGDKSWVTDAAGVRWETFFTFGEATTYGEDPDATHERPKPSASACCGPATAAVAHTPAASCC